MEYSTETTHSSYFQRFVLPRGGVQFKEEIIIILAIFLSKKPFSLLNIVSDIAKGLRVGGFSSPGRYPCRPRRAYRICLLNQKCLRQKKD